MRTLDIFFLYLQCLNSGTRKYAFHWYCFLAEICKTSNKFQNNLCLVAFIKIYLTEFIDKAFFLYFLCRLIGQCHFKTKRTYVFQNAEFQTNVLLHKHKEAIGYFKINNRTVRINHKYLNTISLSGRGI